VAVLVSAACGVALPGSQSSPVGNGAAATGQLEPYIVVLEDGTTTSPVVVAGQHVGFGVTVGQSQVFSHALAGFTADLSTADVAALRADERVAAVEPDQVVQLAQAPSPGQQVSTGVQRISGDDNPALTIDGVDDIRIDVDVAVIDSGVADHRDLNVVARADCTVGPACVEGAGLDDNGHGTHVAGIVGAIDNDLDVVGVAPGARLHSVKVCGSTGQCLLSAMVASLDYVTAHAGTIEVVNMSVAGPGSSPALDQAVTGAIDAGVVLVVASGNEHNDVAGYFPGSHPDVIAVSALADFDGAPGGLAAGEGCRPGSPDDVLADFSNFGTGIDVAAPGVCIVSTWNDGGVTSQSGTSMAAPHVAGTAALLAAGAADPTSRQAVMAIRQVILDNGTADWTDVSGDGIQEPLLDLAPLG
jgi:subtilisin family serine protease